MLKKSNKITCYVELHAIDDYLTIDVYRYVLMEKSAARHHLHGVTSKINDKRVFSLTGKNQAGVCFFRDVCGILSIQR